MLLERRRMHRVGRTCGDQAADLQNKEAHSPTLSVLVATITFIVLQTTLTAHDRVRAEAFATPCTGPHQRDWLSLLDEGANQVRFWTRRRWRDAVRKSSNALTSAHNVLRTRPHKPA